MAPELASSLRHESLHVCGLEGVVERRRVEVQKVAMTTRESDGSPHATKVHSYTIGNT
jgi:hypothetical protein